MPATPLHLAAIDGDNDAVNRLLIEGMDIHAATDRGETPLQLAAQSGHIEVVRTLLKFGANPNYLPPGARNVLRVAVRGRHDEIVRLLLARGADPGAVAPPRPETDAEKDEARKNRELLAERRKREEETLSTLGFPEPSSDHSFERFLKEKAERPDEEKPPERKDPKRQLLTDAIMSGSVETVRLLLEAGFPVKPGDDTTQVGMSPLQLVCGMRENVEMARLLLRYGADPNESDGTTTVLGQAVLFGNVEVAEALIDAGADVLRGLDSHLSLLALAAQRGNRNMVEFLLKRLPPDAVVTDDIAQELASPEIRQLLLRHIGIDWFEAVESGDESRVRQAIHEGANVNAADSSGDTALISAVEKGHTAIVRLLLESGADPGWRNEMKATALHKAAVSGNLEIVSLLLDRGANPRAENKFGMTPLLTAALEARSEVVDRLIEAGAALSIVEAILLRRTEALADFGQRGTPVDYANEAGMTPLHAAAQIGDTELAAKLLDQGASINPSDRLGFTPLGRAIRQGHFPQVTLLVDRGADIRAAEGSPWQAPLMLAIQSNRTETVRFLLERGVDPDEGGILNTPIEWAAVFWKPEMIRLLLERGATTNGQNRKGANGSKTLLDKVLSMASSALEKPDFTRSAFGDIENLWETLRWIMAQGIEPPEEGLIFRQSKAILPALLELGAPIDLFEQAIAQGVSVHPESRFQRSPLMDAVERNRRDATELLLKAGANPNASTTAESPLTIAEREGYHEIVALLRQYGASEEKRQATLSEMRSELPPEFQNMPTAISHITITDAFKALIERRRNSPDDRRAALEKELSKGQSEASQEEGT